MADHGDARGLTRKCILSSVFNTGSYFVSTTVTLSSQNSRLHVTFNKSSFRIKEVLKCVDKNVFYLSNMANSVITGVNSA